MPDSDSHDKDSAGPLHAFEITPADAALLRALTGAVADDVVRLPSGKTLTGAEVERYTRGRSAEDRRQEVPAGVPDGFRVATVNEYVRWLSTWLLWGNKPTHYYDYPFDRWTWLTATRDVATGGECGANAQHIIIPRGVAYAGGALGHNQLYLAGVRPHQHGRQVPIFNDPIFPRLPRIKKFIEAKKAEQDRWRREHGISS